jgi:hypothetical protein
MKSKYSKVSKFRLEPWVWVSIIGIKSYLFVFKIALKTKQLSSLLQRRHFFEAVRSFPSLSKVALFTSRFREFNCSFGNVFCYETTTLPPTNLLFKKNMKHKKLIEIPPYYIDHNVCKTVWLSLKPCLWTTTFVDDRTSLIHYTFFKTKCNYRSLKTYFIDKYIYFKILS